MDSATEILVWIGLSLVPAWLLWQFSRFAARGFRAFADPAVDSRIRITGACLHGLAALTLLTALLSELAWQNGAAHLIGVALCFFLGGVWLMSTLNNGLPRWMRISVVIEFVIGVTVMLVGVIYAMRYPHQPVVGTASMAELLSVIGFGIAFAGLWSVAPGPGGPPGGGGGGGCSGGC